MRSLRQFFEYLNDIDFKYVVLRNWENLPDNVETGDHSDLDLLVYDYEHFLEIFPDVILEWPHPRVRYKMKIGDSFIFMDVRHLGDGYYPADFEKNILETREWNDAGFWTPNPLHFRLALAYHVVHHKNYNDYHRWLGNVSVKELLEALKQSNIGWVEPTDKSVGTFNRYWKGATSVVDKGENTVKKTQTSFMGYRLIDNEARILKNIDSIHFPKVLSSDNESIEIENCGEMIELDNLPKDWKKQLLAILLELKAHNVQHRDIKPDNLMVKDGIIKLIDFGWAKYYDEKDRSPVPSCLGFPYKPSNGHDDIYSMNKIIKEFDFKLEERVNQLCEF